jgi:hypothetical protein
MGLARELFGMDTLWDAVELVFASSTSVFSEKLSEFVLVVDSFSFEENPGFKFVDILFIVCSVFFVYSYYYNYYNFLLFKIHFFFDYLIYTKNRISFSN